MKIITLEDATSPPRCTHRNLEYVRVIAANGAVAIRQRCADCSKIGTASYAHGDHPHRDSYPLARDNRKGAPICERCGAPETEYHHWAPSALFDDSDRWPGAYLCRPCHARWHTTVTPWKKYRGGDAA